jgi:peptidyl-prolyl isomerase D
MGGESIYGESFADEAFVHQHDRPFLLSMANSGPATNGSQFFITTKECGHLDGRHVIFGQVLKGTDTVRLIEAEMVDESSNPLKPCVVVNCGELKPGEPDGVEVDPLDPYPNFPGDSPRALQLSDKIFISSQIRTSGNALFKEGKWPEAVRKYSKAIRYIEDEDFPSPEEAKEQLQAKIPALLNRAAAYLKCPEADAPLKAQADCEEVLKQEPENAKALLRLGQARLNRHETEEALPFLTRASALLPDDKGLATLVAKTKRQVAEAQRKQAQAFSKMFSS